MINASVVGTPPSAAPSVPSTPVPMNSSVVPSVPPAAPNYTPKKLGADHKPPIKKIIIGVVAFLLLSVGAVTAFYLSQTNSDIRQQASTGGVYGNLNCTDYRTAGECPTTLCQWIPQGSVCAPKSIVPSPTPLQLKCYKPPQCSTPLSREGKCESGEYTSIQECAQKGVGEAEEITCYKGGACNTPIKRLDKCESGEFRTVAECARFGPQRTFRSESGQCVECQTGEQCPFKSKNECEVQLTTGRTYRLVGNIPDQTCEECSNTQCPYVSLTQCTNAGTQNSLNYYNNPPACGSDSGLFDSHVPNSSLCSISGDNMYACNAGYINYNNGCSAVASFQACGSGNGLHLTAVANSHVCLHQNTVWHECNSGYVPSGNTCVPIQAQTTTPLVTCYAPPLCTSGTRRATCASGEYTSTQACLNSMTQQTTQTSTATQVTEAPAQATAQSGNLFGAVLTGGQ